MNPAPEVKAELALEAPTGTREEGGSPVQPMKLTPALRQLLAHRPGLGLTIALAVIGGWWANLVYLMTTPLSQQWTGGVGGFLLQIVLGTGLFITAHDAIHGTVSRHRWVNTAVGWICTSSFAMLSYRVLAQAHGFHHRFPASAEDPDFHDGVHTDPMRWFVAFMRRYMSIWIFVLWVPLGWVGLYLLLRPDWVNLFLFWPSPAIVSAIQLFYFGTYLTHREPVGGYQNVHRAESNQFGLIRSFFTCYHFGYHLEHHRVPRAPWWQLPAVRRLLTSDLNSALTSEDKTDRAHWPR